MYLFVVVFLIIKETWSFQSLFNHQLLLLLPRKQFVILILGQVCEESCRDGNVSADKVISNRLTGASKVEIVLRNTKRDQN